MSDRTDASGAAWEGRVFRAWVRLIPGAVTRDFEEELGGLFRDRLDEITGSPLRRGLLLARCAIDVRAL